MGGKNYKNLKIFYGKVKKYVNISQAPSPATRKTTIHQRKIVKLELEKLSYYGEIFCLSGAVNSVVVT